MGGRDPRGAGPQRRRAARTLTHDVGWSGLRATEPPDFHWATYQIEDSREFVEVAIGHPLPGPLLEMASFARYRAALDDRCETKQFDMAGIVGTYTARTLAP